MHSTRLASSLSRFATCRRPARSRVAGCRWLAQCTDNWHHQLPTIKTVEAVKTASRPWRVVILMGQVVTPCNSNITIHKITISMGAIAVLGAICLPLHGDLEKILVKSISNLKRLGREGWGSWSRGQLICGHHGNFNHFRWILLGISWIVQSNCFLALVLTCVSCFFPQQFTRTSLKRCGFWYVSTAMFWWLVRGIPCWQKLKIIRCLFCLCLGKKNGMHLESHSIPAICKHNGTWPKHVPSTYRYNYAYDAWASLLKLKKYVVCSTLRDPGCSESPIWHISIWLFHAVSTGEPFLCEKYPHFGWWREITVFRIQNRSIWVDVFLWSTLW